MVKQAAGEGKKGKVVDKNKQSGNQQTSDNAGDNNEATNNVQNENQWQTQKRENNTKKQEDQQNNNVSQDKKQAAAQKVINTRSGIDSNSTQNGQIEPNLWVQPPIPSTMLIIMC